MSNNKLLIHAWTVHKIENKYYLPYTHWVYLNEIEKYFQTICLLSPINQITNKEKGDLVDLEVFKKIEVKELPYSKGYSGAIKHFFSYYKAYKNLKDIDVFYARYPIPFGWLAKVFYRDKKRIVHFVGDPIDVIQGNPNLSYFKKKLLITAFQPEHHMYLWACRDSKVYTNGWHISENLKRKGINAKGLISSTLKSEDFFIDKNKTIDPSRPRIIYLGYLRKAKGIETLLKAFQLLQISYPGAEFTIVGQGELEESLRNIILKEKIKNVKFLGHIDNRDQLNMILRSHDIFCFGSLSEGSPRVVLEAMANGLAVVSTPVGSLPTSFNDEENILFANFNDHNAFSNKISKLINDPELYKKIKSNASIKVKNYTIEIFLKKIFNEK